MKLRNKMLFVLTVQMLVAGLWVMQTQAATDDTALVKQKPAQNALMAIPKADTPAAMRSATAPADTDIILDGVTAAPDTMDTTGHVDKMPVLTSFVEALYPAALQKKGIEGTVLMNLVVNDSGRVDSVAIVKGLFPALDTPAMKAARQFVFTPAIADSQRVAVLLQYEYRFSLNEVVTKLDKYVNFSGRLIEKGTKKPVCDAMIVINFIDTASDTTLPLPFRKYIEKIGRIEGQFLEEDRLVTLTDSTGHFQFFSLPADTIEIKAPVPGYKDFTEREVITPREALQINYYVERVSYSDYEIVVYGKTQEKEVAKYQLTLTEVKKIPGLGGDAVKVVQALPGVARPTFGSGAIVVRGAPSWDSKYLLDGVSIPQLYHFGGLKSVYNSDALEKVDFYPGGWGVRTGGAIAGVIDLQGREAKSNRWQGKVDLGTIDGSFLAEGPLGKKASILLSARRSFIGDILGLYFKYSTQDLPVTTSPHYWDYIVRTDVHPTDKHHIFLTAFGSRDTMAIILKTMQGGSPDIDSATNALKMSQNFHLGIAGWDWTINHRLKNSLRYMIDYSYSNFSVFGFAKVEQNYWQHHLRDELTWTISPKLKIYPGADLDMYDLNLWLKIPDASNTIRPDSSKNWYFGVMGGYLFAEWKPWEKVTVIPGLRYDYYPELKHKGSVLPEFWEYSGFDNTSGYSADPSLRLSLRYQVTKKHTIKGAIGNYNQTPQPMGQVLMEKWGDPFMPTTRASHYVLGYEWQITDLIHADIQAYHNYQWNIPRIADTNDIKIHGPDAKWFHDEEGRMNGLEILLRHDQSGRFFGWIAYSLSSSQRFNKWTRRWELYGKDQTNNLQVVASWHLPREWDVGFRARYVTGNPTTPVVGREYNTEYKAFLPLYGERNSTRMDPFFQLDIRVDKKIVYKKWMYSMYIDLQNISYFLYKSPEMELWNYDYTQKSTVSGFFQPGIGFMAEF